MFSVSVNSLMSKIDLTVYVAIFNIACLIVMDNIWQNNSNCDYFWNDFGININKRYRSPTFYQCSIFALFLNESDNCVLDISPYLKDSCTHSIKDSLIKFQQIFKILLVIRHCPVICCFGSCLEQIIIPQRLFHIRRIVFVALIMLVCLNCLRTVG